ncbi:hypothetical protein MCAG_04182 [Micromonospora sp. ATCC 39149]|nr:hypothetical protein MCAG_04182 [Micromonospora sp. ATCC 39149]
MVVEEVRRARDSPSCPSGPHPPREPPVSGRWVVHLPFTAADLPTARRCARRTDHDGPCSARPPR